MADGFVFHLIAHTHWDREWYLPRAGFLARLVPALDDLVDRLERDPGFRTFLLDGQTILLEDYLGVRPEREPRVRALVTEGRLQVGPWYVLADEQIPSAESLVRNLLLGGADARRLGGRSDVYYSPDAFGHSPAGPTLARGFGLLHAALWRGVGDAPAGPDLLRWSAPDGSTILVYHLPPDGYEIGGALPADLLRLSAEWRGVRERLLPRATTRHVAVFVGADHHAAHPEPARLRDLLAELEPGSAVRVSRLDEFLAEAAAEERGRAPAVAGELRWSYGYTWTLQGVHGTRAAQKRRNAGLELLLERYAEPLAALEVLRGTEGRGAPALLRAAWRTLVQCHFHDSICGSAADEVARALDARFDEVEALGLELVRGAVDRLAGHDPDQVREDPGLASPALLLWNPAPRARGGVTIADLTFFRRDVFVGPPGGRTPREGVGATEFSLRLGDGTLLPVQVLHRGRGLERLDAARHYPDQDEVDVVRVAFEAPPVPGLAFGRLEPGSPGAGAREGVWARGREVANAFVRAEIGSDGTVAIRDQRTGARWEGLLALESGGDVGDCYTYCPPPGDRLLRSESRATVRPLATGPLVAALEARWTGPRGCPARLVLSLHADSPAVRCALELENRATDHRLRLRLPTGLAAVRPLAGTHFGAVSRAPVAVDPHDFPRETPVATAPAHRFVAVAQDPRGLALLAPGFFEYEWTPEGDLLYTVLRAVGELSRPELPTRPGHAGWPTPTPLAQSLGTHRIELALLPTDAPGAADAAALLRAWEDVFLPLRGYWRRQCSSGAAPDVPGVELLGESLALSCLKPAEAGEGVVLRCVNLAGRPAEGAWRLGRPVREALRARLDETELEPLAVEHGRVVRFAAAPHEVVTVLVR